MCKLRQTQPAILRGGTNEPAEQSENVLRNDGTNACAFLSVKIADVILSEVVTGIEFFVELAEAIEDNIWRLPEKINEHQLNSNRNSTF